MKHILLLLFVFISFYAAAQKTDEQAIKAVMNKQAADWSHGDVNGFMQTYLKSDSLMFIGSKGITYGWDSTLAHYKKNYPDKTAMGKLSFELKEMKPLPDQYYFVVGKFLLERESGNLSGYFDLLFKKIGGKWYIISDHTS